MKLVLTRRVFGGAVLLLVVMLLAGCNVAGVLANGLRGNVPAAYKGLAGQSVVVYVWADPGLRTDWPDITFNLSGGILEKLKQAQDAKVDELKETKFPMSAAMMTRFQEDHPELETEPFDHVAPSFGAKRVIYVEISSFQTRANDSVELYRGEVTAIVKVLEVKDGKVTTGFEDRNVAAVYPPKSPAEGLADLTDDQVYQGVMKELSTQIVVRFIPHDTEDEQDEINK